MFLHILYFFKQPYQKRGHFTNCTLLILVNTVRSTGSPTVCPVEKGTEEEARVISASLWGIMTSRQKDLDLTSLQKADTFNTAAHAAAPAVSESWA